MDSYRNSNEHYDTKIVCRLGDLSGLWVNLNDKQRIEIIKSIIWTAPDMHSFRDKVLKTIASEKFEETLD